MSAPTPAMLAEALPGLAGVSVLAVGDIMLDRFIQGSVERISPEAPIPVLRARSERQMLGGVGNVARNLAALGARARVVCTIGEDTEGDAVRALLTAEPGLEAHAVPVAGRPTTLKTRLIGGAQQMLRVDREDTGPLPAAAAAAVLADGIAAMDGVAAVILSDYGKGALPAGVVAALIEAARARGLPVVVDPKGRDYIRYHGASVVTPNLAELMLAVGHPVDGDAGVVDAARRLAGEAGIEAVFATRSRDGLSVVEETREWHFPARAREVFDVSGAGDTVVAVTAAALAAGISLAIAGGLANAAGGVVVGKAGTASVALGEIADALAQTGDGGVKVASLGAALGRVERWRASGLSVGFTNGCFDILHPGHASLLAEARSTCDRLIVGLNDDASVRRLKGESRPIQDLGARATLLGALEAVDLVVPFAEDTPLALIEALAPDVLIKGADYTRETVVGADIVERRGGRVHLAGLIEGQSTTAIATRLKG